MFFKALKRACPVPVGFEDIPSGAKGYYHTVDQRIALQEGMSQVQTVKTMIHEMAHQKLHAIDPKDLPPEEPRLTRNAKEVEAEAVAYTVAQHYGIETSDYSFALPYDGYAAHRNNRQNHGRWNGKVPVHDAQRCRTFSLPTDI